MAVEAAASTVVEAPVFMAAVAVASMAAVAVVAAVAGFKGGLEHRQV